MTWSGFGPIGLIIVGASIVLLGIVIGRAGAERPGLVIMDLGGLIIILAVLWGIAIATQPEGK